MSAAMSYEDLQERLDDLYEELLQVDLEVGRLAKRQKELRDSIMNLERQAEMALDRELGGRGY
jgi:predicted  nucleic acid-binding Zn-ribbon protein